MTPTEIKKALSEFGGQANKRLGQHFLIDNKVLETIVETADIHAGDTVLEVGPGLGVLTSALLDHGAEVMAIEQDRRMVEYLEKNVRARRAVPLRIVQGNAAYVHWHELTDEKSWKFVSNLPYGITSLALRKALYSPRPPLNIVVLVQREVGERATTVGAGSPRPGAETAPLRHRGKTSLLSLMVALASSSTRIVRRVSADAFYPPPKVESVILQITPMTLEDRIKRWGMEPEKIMEIARQGFAHPRKLLKSNLSTMGPGSFCQGRGIPSLRQLDIPEKARPEDLSPDDWVRLCGFINLNDAGFIP
ncbi:MAG: 16S rRNA (adenine(1518)-N(6)/adenine(1519)-N(6))-dimethyltransferase RsmA [Patescibacteria group bacterium]